MHAQMFACTPSDSETQRGIKTHNVFCIAFAHPLLAAQALSRPCAGYVEQFDTLLPELTVQEMLMYTAELKCPTSVR